ncbi:peptidase S41 [Chitinibacter bivalviorum]|uniref:Peptidase S41 n=1 Tax=Chitinibacter bivalviorum TaxID=2739434 RepID=A0A7H9BJ08_9NEIS|nr:S41 family peptidase [Chitinibacter bivalviorum]QLG88635.1 peptidase S41 [Chitinibacter bivalviorum]
MNRYWHGNGKTFAQTSVAILSTAVLVGCGGGGSTTLAGSSTPAPSSTPSASQMCAANNPYRHDVADHQIGTLNDEKSWVKNYVNDAYLWYQDIPAVDANASKYSDNNDVYGSLDNYFQALKSPLITASGAKKDKFSFTYPTKKWQQLFASGGGFGYGIQWKQSRTTAPWQLQVAYVTPNSPAEKAGIQRGDTLKMIDGLIVDGSNPALQEQVDALLSPSNSIAHNLVITRTGSSDRTVSLSADNISLTPVLLSKTFSNNNSQIAYLVFNEHIATAEQGLNTAIAQFKSANVDTLVLDLRYNGGGYLYIASMLSYMIAGPAATTNKIFEQSVYNNKRAAETTKDKVGFINTSCLPDASGYCTKYEALPTLNLKKVFILTSASTCSASESIINGLRGVDVDVQIIGNTTCGKPYGFYGKSNCGISYFPMEFQGFNNKGFGDFADGFTPTCQANDDLSKPLGDITEGMLAAALYRNANPSACLTSNNALNLNPQDKGKLLRPTVLENKFWNTP